MKESGELLKKIIAIIRDRRESPRFFGRRSLDKKRGEVCEIIDGEPRVFLTISLPNFQGEEAASLRAESMNDICSAELVIEALERTI